jgi:hypothetical protein
MGRFLTVFHLLYDPLYDPIFPSISNTEGPGRAFPGGEHEKNTPVKCLASILVLISTFPRFKMGYSDF